MIIVPFMLNLKTFKMNIFEELRKEHEIQRELLEKLLKTSGSSEERGLIFKKLKHELEIHADAEERFFYKPLFDKDRTQDQARHGVAEHHELDELIEKLEKTEMDVGAWANKAKKLSHDVEHHLEDEEHQFFQIAGKVLTEKEKTKLGRDYRAYIEENRVA